jgi:3-hydroxyacyl-[acyl-carrier-protein] dehydratase
MSVSQTILDLIPQQPPFLYVDEIISVDEEAITGTYTFKRDEFFYSGHFPDYPVTPGVILTECMAQIGLVCHGIYHLIQQDGENSSNYRQFFTESHATFLKPVLPEEKVTVSAKKSYFRHGKFKTKAKMTNSAGEVVCTAELSGFVKII